MSYRTWAAMLATPCLALAAMIFSHAADAQRRDRNSPTVTACSRYGNGCVTGPTRPSRFDREVRMPGGTWIACKLDCRETLREETVDFFDTIRERAPGNFR